MGGQVAYGEKGTAIQFGSLLSKGSNSTPDGMPIINAQGHPEFETVDLKKSDWAYQACIQCLASNGHSILFGAQTRV